MKTLELNPQFAIEEALLDRQLQLLQRQQYLHIVSHEIGADREQWLIRFHNELFIVFIEWLAESAWLEPVQKEGESHLPTLAEHFP